MQFEGAHQELAALSVRLAVQDLDEARRRRLGGEMRESRPRRRRLLPAGSKEDRRGKGQGEAAKR